MERELAEVLPIWGMEKGCIVSKMGDYTAAFEVTKPEIFTLSAADYENLHQTLVKAIKVLPANCVLHFQDWYTGARYSDSADKTDKVFWIRPATAFSKAGPILIIGPILYYPQAARTESGQLRFVQFVPKESRTGRNA